MAKPKQIVLNYSASGLTVYCIVQRNIDGFLLSNLSGSFEMAPADYNLAMTENGVISGRYELTESRSIWQNGLYSVAIYKQGDTPVMIGDGEMVIEDDAEVTGSLSSLPWLGTTTVEDMLHRVLPSLQTASIDIYTAINGVTNLIFKRLWKRNSDLVTADILLVAQANSGVMTLPEHFKGLSGKPFLLANGSELDPLPAGGRARYSGKPGRPQYYELIQNRFYIYPTPTVTTMIKSLYVRDPGKVSVLTDILPFAGMFDEVYAEAIVKFSMQPVGVISDQVLAVFIESEVDAIVPVRSSPLPSRRPVKYF